MFLILGNQGGMRMRRIVTCSLPGSQIFFHIIGERNNFPKKKLLNIKCVFSFTLQILSEMFLFLKKMSEILSYMYKRPHIK
jgi:hypothetical protein